MPLEGRCSRYRAWPWPRLIPYDSVHEARDLHASRAVVRQRHSLCPARQRCLSIPKSSVARMLPPCLDAVCSPANIRWEIGCLSALDPASASACGSSAGCRRTFPSWPGGTRGRRLPVSVAIQGRDPGAPIADQLGDRRTILISTECAWRSSTREMAWVSCCTPSTMMVVPPVTARVCVTVM